MSAFGMTGTFQIQYAWQIFVLKFLLVVVTAWLFVRLSLSFLLSTFLHSHIRIGHVGWFSFGNIQWEIGRHAWNTSKTLRVHRVNVGRIGWVIRSGSAKHNDAKGIGWLGFALTEVTAEIALVAPKSLSTVDPAPPQENGNTVHGDGNKQDAHRSGKYNAPQRHVAPSTILGQFRAIIVNIHQARRALRTRLVELAPKLVGHGVIRARDYFTAPLRSVLDSFVRRAMLGAQYLAIELANVVISMPEIQYELRLQSLLLGAQIVRGQQNYIEFWSRIENIALSAQQQTQDTCNETVHHKNQSVTPVLSVSETFTIEARASFDPAVGISGLCKRNSSGSLEPRKSILDVHAGFESEAVSDHNERSKVRPSVHVFMTSALDLANRITSRLSPKPHLGPHLGPHMHRPTNWDTDGPMHTLSETSSPIATRQNPLGMLKAVRFVLPLCLVEAEVQSSDHTPLKYIYEAKLRGLAIKIALGEVIDNTRKHSEWFGSRTALKAAAGCGFEKLEINAMAVSNNNYTVVSASRLIEITASGASLTSTWLPRRLDMLVTPVQDLITEGKTAKAAFVEDRNACIAIIECDIGGIHGEVGIDMLEDILRLLAVANTAPAGPHTDASTPDRHNDLDKLLYTPPSIVMAVELGRCGYRITGPKKEHKSHFGPGEDGGDLTNGWKGPSAMVLSIPFASFHVSTAYTDVCLQRTLNEKKEMLRLLRKGKIPIPDVLSASLDRQSDGGAPPGLSRSTRLRLFDFSGDSLGEDDESGSATLSPMESPAAFPRNQQSPTHADLSDCPFIRPGNTSGSFNAPVTIAVRASEDGMRMHHFVYKVQSYLNIGRSELCLIGHPESSIANATRTNPTSAGTSRTSFPPQSSTSPSTPSRQQPKTAYLERFDLLSFGPVTFDTALEMAGSEVRDRVATMAGIDTHSAVVDCQHRRATIRLQIENVLADLTRISVHDALNGLVQRLYDVKSSFHASSFSGIDTAQPASCTSHQEHLDSAPIPGTRPFIDRLLSDVHVVLGIGNIDIHVAGPDPKCNPGVCRGVAIQIQTAVIECYKQSRPHKVLVEPHVRASLGLQYDLFAHANVEQSRLPHIPQGYVMLSLAKLSINPLKDAGTSSRSARVLRAKTSVNSEGQEEAGSAVPWELRNRDKLLGRKAHRYFDDVKNRQANISHALIRDYVWLPSLSVRISTWADEDASSPVSHFGIDLSVPTIIIRIEIFPIYCYLMAFSALQSLLPIGRSPTSASAASVPDHLTHQQAVVRFRATLPELHAYLDLGHNVQLFARFRNTRVTKSSSGETVCYIEHGIVAVASVSSKGRWEDLLRLREWNVTLSEEDSHKGYGKHSVNLSGMGARLRIPFAYPFSEVIEHSATFVKTLKQLMHQFIQGQYNFVINPHPEDAKKLPRIRVALKVLVLEAEDDPFETRINLIWRAGVAEQAERVKRWKVFDDKVAQHKADIQAWRDGGCEGAGPQHAVQEQDARAMLMGVNSTKWVQRHRNAVATRVSREEAQLRRLYAGRVTAGALVESGLPIDLISTTGSTPLFRMALESPVLEFTKPSFSESPTGLQDFLFDVGKGMPKDTQYSLLIPFRIHWQMSEARVTLRDFPLPLLHVPPVDATDHNHKSWQLSSDFVIAEEMGGPETIRYVPSLIVPRAGNTGSPHVPYIMEVPRTAMPVKMYAVPKIVINSKWATRIGWGNSIQPTIQDVMRVIDSLTKSPPDPSERMGFWDKIRLKLHWRICIDFEGEGPLHFILKGSRDPYSLEHTGAGFALCWSKSVRWQIGHKNNENEFFQIHSKEFVLAVPDLKDFVDAAATGIIKRQTMSDAVDESGVGIHSSHDSARPVYRTNQDFAKVCAKFLGGVRWGIGMRMERACRPDTCITGKCSGSLLQRACRLWDFVPHYKVSTLSGPAVRPSPEHDSFAGFRSDFVHFSVSVAAPDAQEKANSIHMTPNAFDHFWSWWHLFDGTLSLPIRQGRIFPSTQPASKKFGKSCATIKYRAQLSPVFIAHTSQQHERADEWREGFTTLFGIKGRIDHFNVDLHQREEVDHVWSEGLNMTRRRTHKPFWRAEVDCRVTDLRVLVTRYLDVTKRLVGTTMAFAPEEPDDVPELFGLDDPDNQHADDDQAWLDRDDYCDLGIRLPEQTPRFRMWPCFTSPRLTYSRNTEPQHVSLEDDGSAQSDRCGVSKFNKESTHFCLLDRAASPFIHILNRSGAENVPNTDPIDVQLALAQDRSTELEQELLQAHMSKMDATANDIASLHRQLEGIDKLLDRYRLLQKEEARRRAATAGQDDQTAEDNFASILQDKAEGLDSNIYADIGEFVNRLVIHNPHVVVTQQIRDILLRYYYNSRTRKLLEYAMTAKAIKFIKDLIVDESDPNEAREQERRQRAQRRRGPPPNTAGKAKHKDYGDLLDELLKDDGVRWSLNSTRSGRTTSAASESDSLASTHEADPHAEAAQDLADTWSIRNSFIVSIFKPQIALNSDTSIDTTLIVSALAVQLRSFAVMDEKHIEDPVNALVMHRNFGTIDQLQAFYPHMRGWRSGKRSRLLGSAAGFVPLEVLAGYADDPADLDRIVPRTGARLRYDKHNRLRLARNRDSSGGRTKLSDSCSSSVDRLLVDCERFSVSATPTHYGAIYEVITGLILYTDPNQKARSQKIEKIVLSKSFSDRQGIARQIEMQQQELRALMTEAIRDAQVGVETLSPDELLRYYTRGSDILNRMDVLTLWMSAIQTAQNTRNSGRSMGMQLDAKAREIVWHMREEHGTPLVKVAIQRIQYRWLNSSDGSVSNALVIGDLNALNSSPDQYFPEIVSKYFPTTGEQNTMRSDLFAVLLWSIQSPVGGIAVVDRLETHLHFIRLQLEQTIGKKVMNYIFQQRSPRNVGKGSSRESSPTRDNGGDPSGRKRLAKTPSRESLLYGRQSQEVVVSPRSDVSSLRVPGSASSTASMTSSRAASLRQVSSNESLGLIAARMDDYLDAEEMRERARLNRAFLHVEIFPTTFCLSFKGSKSTSVPDVYGLIYKFPPVVHCNRIWTYLDLITSVKKDWKASVWAQGAGLLGQVLTTARRPGNVKNVVQQRLLGHSGNDKSSPSQPTGFRKKRTFTGPFRLRASNSGEPAAISSVQPGPTSPLRASVLGSRTDTPHVASHNDSQPFVAGSNESDSDHDTSSSSSSPAGDSGNDVLDDYADHSTVFEDSPGRSGSLKNAIVTRLRHPTGDSSATAFTATSS